MLELFIEICLNNLRGNGLGLNDQNSRGQYYSTDIATTADKISDNERNGQ